MNGALIARQLQKKGTFKVQFTERYIMAHNNTMNI